MAWPQPLPEVLSLRCASAATSQLGLLALVAPPGGLEPPTVCLEGSCSIPLSYGGFAHSAAGKPRGWRHLRWENKGGEPIPVT